MRILLIEDDHDLCYSLAFQLEKKGYQVDTCEDGADADYYTSQPIYDLILLDRMLPHMDGLTILKKLRSTDNAVPVILLTALGELEDKIHGLDAGADDYLVKPFAFEELLARIRCIRRRPRTWENSDLYSFADITYNTTENTLTGPLGTCTLSKKEGALLEYLLKNASDKGLGTRCRGGGRKFGQLHVFYSPPHQKCRLFCGNQNHTRGRLPA